MEDRLDALGGTLQIASSPGNGTTLRMILPMAAAVRSAASSAMAVQLELEKRVGRFRCATAAPGLINHYPTASPRKGTAP